MLDDLSMGRRENVPAGARFVEGDVRDPAAVRDALDGRRLPCFHEAAIVSIRASVEHFVRDAEVNLMGTLNLLQQMADRADPRAPCSPRRWRSTPTARGPSRWPKTRRTEPIAPYGAAKLAAERYWLHDGRAGGRPGHRAALLQHLRARTRRSRRTSASSPSSSSRLLARASRR